jgi:hypothetical protein
MDGVDIVGCLTAVAHGGLMKLHCVRRFAKFWEWDISLPPESFCCLGYGFLQRRGYEEMGRKQRERAEEAGRTGESGRGTYERHFDSSTSMYSLLGTGAGQRTSLVSPEISTVEA